MIELRDDFDGSPSIGWTGYALPEKATPWDTRNMRRVTLPGGRVPGTSVDALLITVGPGDAVYPGDTEQKKERAELLGPRTGGQPGDVSWYSWRMWVPPYDPFRSDPRLGLWQVCGQWHDLTPGDTNVPPLAVRWLHAEDGTRALRFAYEAGSHQQYATHQLPPDGPWPPWVSLKFRVRWSLGWTGTADVFVDGQKIAAFTGRNLWSAEGCQLRLGIYRKGGDAISTVLFDRVRQATEEGEV